MGMLKKCLSFLCAVFIMSTPMTAYASEFNINNSNQEVINIQVNDEIGFALFKSQDEDTNTPISFANKKYVNDSYNGYFYYTSNNKKISEHKFTAKFSYDNTMASCYDTSSSIVMVDNDSNLRPSAENEGRNNLTPTQVYGYVTFVLYNTDDSVNTEATVKIYCNQEGKTWVNRQG